MTAPTNPPAASYLRRLLEGSNTTPWEQESEPGDEWWFGGDDQVVRATVDNAALMVGSADDAHDIELAVAAVNALPHLLDRIETLDAVVARLNDGWTYTLPPADPKYRRGLWWRVQNGPGEWVVPEGADQIPTEPMTPAERQVIYGKDA